MKKWLNSQKDHLALKLENFMIEKQLLDLEDDW